MDATTSEGSLPADPQAGGGKKNSWSGDWRLAGVAAVLAAATALGGVALGRSGSSSASPPKSTGNAQLTSANGGGVTSGATITVTGSGTVQGTPDTVSFQIGAQTTAGSATAALANNNAKVSALESSLEKSGVSAKDMQTSDLEIWQNTNSSGALTGFTVDDNINVTMHNLSDAGKAIDAAANAEGDAAQLNGITFSISNQSSLLAAARAKAMQNAATEASDLAAGAGLSLGGIVRVTDQENQPATPVYFNSVAAPSASVPLKAGTQPVSVQVTVVYALRS